MATVLRNIAVLVHSLNSGGAERIAGLLSKELAKFYNVYVFVWNTKNIAYEYGGTLVDMGISGPFYEYAVSVNKKKYDIDCAISFLEEMNFSNIRTKGKECVIISERCVQSRMQPPLTAEIRKLYRYYQNADAIVACSEGVRYDLMYNYQIKGNIATIYNFIDKENIIKKSQEDLPDEVQKFLKDDAFFLNVGRLHPQKNQKRLIRQFAYFYKSNPDMKLLILGNGKLEGELTDDIRELGLEEQIRIIPYTSNPFAYMARAKAIILASHYEGLPNALLEAMTLGCPVIATDCLAGPRELLLDHFEYEQSLKPLEVCKRGILVCDNETEDSGISQYMAKAMEMICSQMELRETFSRNGRKYMEQYSNGQILKQWIQVIETCVRKEEPSVLDREEAILKTAKYIVIYGAGVVGKNIFIRLSDRYKIDCFVVSQRKPGEQECLGIPLVALRELSYPAEDTAVIIGVGNVGEFQTEVINNLTEHGYEKIVFPYITLWEQE